MATVNLSGVSYELAPLRYRQVNKVVLTRRDSSKAEIEEGVQRGVAFSLKNAGAFPDKSVNEVMDILDEQLSPLAHTDVWLEVLKLTGLMKDEPESGEVPAALSTSTESAAE